MNNAALQLSYMSVISLTLHVNARLDGNIHYLFSRLPYNHGYAIKALNIELSDLLQWRVKVF